MIPYGRHDITQSDVDAVMAALATEFLTQGPFVRRFEQALARSVGAGHGVAVNSATSARHFACFFFSSRRRHTRWTGDWSSDVCSSDLSLRAARRPGSCSARAAFADSPP